MKNVTISLDDETAAWARVHAAQNNTSVSRIVGELLQQHMRNALDYELAMKRFFARKPSKLQRLKARYPNREELHDRADLR